MKFIEISKTVCVNTSSVDWVSSVDDGLSSILYCGGKEYPSDIPYPTLVDMLQQDSNTMDKLDKYLSVAQITSL